MWKDRDKATRVQAWVICGTLLALVALAGGWLGLIAGALVHGGVE